TLSSRGWAPGYILSALRAFRPVQSFRLNRIVLFLRITAYFAKIHNSGFHLQKRNGSPQDRGR
ncbi:MAG: hypothetical protein AAB332_07610, partial [Planctomycetota bacterium]